jgi:hypothetical protein
MVLLAIPVGFAAVIVAIRLMTAETDWFARMNAVTRTKVDRERYPLGYAAAKIGTPIVLLVWGVLMALYGLAGAVELIR